MVVGKLIVRVIKAEGLASADMNGKSDPFIKMRLVNQFHRTSTQYRTLNPVWNEMFHFDIKDINSRLDMWVYDEDRHGEDFLGRLMIPLLSIRHKKLIWYQLKDKKLQNPAKGCVQLRLDIEWSVVKASLRTFTPLEELQDPPAPVIKRSLMMNNFVRAKNQIMVLVEAAKYVHSCWQWESKLRSLNAFFLFVVIVYYFELWMAPLAILMLFLFNWFLMYSVRVRKFFGFDETKFAKLSDVRHRLNTTSQCQATTCDPMSRGYLNRDQMILESNCGLIGTPNSMKLSPSPTTSTILPTSITSTSSSSSTTASICSTLRANCILSGVSPLNLTSNISSNNQNDHQTNNNNQQPTISSTQQGQQNLKSPINDDDSGISLVERLSGAKETVIMVQDLTGHIASYLERLSNTFTFKVPFLSYLMMFCLAIASVILYFIPLRYIILAWGINKFSKKLRNPNYIDNNELIDFLSRVPDNLQCIQQQNTIIY